MIETHYGIVIFFLKMFSRGIILCIIDNFFWFKMHLPYLSDLLCLGVGQRLLILDIHETLRDADSTEGGGCAPISENIYTLPYTHRCAYHCGCFTATIWTTAYQYCNSVVSLVELIG